MEISVHNISTASLFLSLLYFMLIIFSFQWSRRLRKKKRHASASSFSFSLTRFFSYCVFLFSILRCVTFVTICAFDYLGYDVRLNWFGVGGLSSTTNSQKFLARAMFVLINMSDFMFLSMAVLLACVWAEVFQHARRHWFSPARLRKRWMILYLSFNLVLYTSQIVLYMLMFTTTEGTATFSKIILVVLISVNFAVPLVVVGGWFALSLCFAGFPFRSSTHERKSNTITKVAVVWSIGRIVWASYATLWIVNPSVFAQATVQQALLVAVYVSAEVFPCLYFMFNKELSSNLVMVVDADDASSSTSLLPPGE